MSGTVPGIADDGGITVRHMSNEQNIIELKPERKYLLLPVQDNAPEGRIFMVQDNAASVPGINIRLARERVDYYVPLDVSDFIGRFLQIDVQAVPASSVCWSPDWAALSCVFFTLGFLPL